MKTFNEMKPRRALAVVGALIFSSTLTAPAIADRPTSMPYKMTVIEDAAYGRKVTSGDYEQAIRKITDDGTRSSGRFADQVNLCVAYAKSTDLQRAGKACNAAIAHLRKQERRATRDRSKSNPVFRRYQRDLAVALSNRGVLLAVSGDAEKAREDFAAAIELQTRVSSIARSNLERLEQSAVPEA